MESKAPFIWRKVVPGKRVTLLAESTLPSVYMRKKLTPLPEPRASFPILVPRAAILLASATDRELWQEPILQSAIRGLPVNCAAAGFMKCGVEGKWLVKGLLIYFTKL